MMDTGLVIVSSAIGAIAAIIDIEQASGRGGGKPAGPASAGRGQGEGTDAARLLKILVVDDDKDFAESLAEILELHGHRITLAYNGEQALGQLQSGLFDLAFVDIMLPALSGVDVLRVISNLQPDTGIVLMTGSNPRHSAQQAKIFGALDILQKPIDPERLMRHVDAVANKPGRR
jgi:CheY-like chemotaxis protein